MHEQQRDAAARSARARTTKKFVRELTSVKPLTLDQRAEIIAAASAIPVVTQ